MEVADHTEHVDLLVIGWGKGGKTLAGEAAARGLRVAVVEQFADMVGGACINVACVPTKVLVHDAEQRRPDDDGAAAFEAAVGRRDSLTAAMRRKNFELLDARDEVLLVSGHAELTGPHEVLVTGGPESMRLSAGNVVINTGTRPALPDGVQAGGRVHDSISIQQVRPLPASLVVVGGGYVGLELAGVFARFGSRVAVLDRGRRPLAGEDPDVAQVAAAVLADDGVRIVSAADVTSIDGAGADDGASARVTYEVDGEPETIDADAVLLAVGRAPQTEGLGLERAGVETDATGYVVVDEHLRTSAPGVFAVGDVNGGPQFTYISLDDYRIVADQLFGAGTRSTADRAAVPSTVFLSPPLARVGLTETAAREQGHTVRVGARPMAEIATAPRAKIEADARGIVKVVVDAESDLVLGAALMHVHSQEVINLVAVAMRFGITASELREQIFTHPSATEARTEVLGLTRENG